MILLLLRFHLLGFLLGGLGVGQPSPVARNGRHDHHGGGQTQGLGELREEPSQGEGANCSDYQSVDGMVSKNIIRLRRFRYYDALVCTSRVFFDISGSCGAASDRFKNIASLKKVLLIVSQLF